MSFLRQLTALSIYFALMSSAFAASKDIAPQKTIDFSVSQSRVFQTKAKIKLVFTSDPTIAEPIVCASNLIVLLGKSPGLTTFSVCDAEGKISTYNLSVTREAPKYPNDPDFTELVSQVQETDPESLEAAYSYLNKHYLSSNRSSFTIYLSSQTGKRNRLTPTLSKSEIDQRLETKANTSIPQSQAKVYQSDCEIKSVISTDNSILLPVLLSTTSYALIGKMPGEATIKILERSGKSHLEKIVTDKSSLPTEGQPWVLLPQDDLLSEYPVTKNLSFDSSEAKLLRLKNRIVRTSISDTTMMDPVVLSEQQIVLIGKRAGGCNLFLWDDVGRVEGYFIQLTGANPRYEIMRAAQEMTSASHIVANMPQILNKISDRQKSNHEMNDLPPFFSAIAIWTAEEKDILMIPD